MLCGSYVDFVIRFHVVDGNLLYANHFNIVFLFPKSIALKNPTLKILCVSLLSFFVFTLRAQEVDVESLNNRVFKFINEQRQAAGLEDIVSSQVLENAAQDQSNYCSETKQETNTQKELKKSTAALRVTFFGGIKDGIPQEIIFSEVTKSSKGVEYTAEELAERVTRKLNKTNFRKIFLRPDLYYTGVGTSFDPLTNKVFFCIVLGDINIVNNTAAHSKDLDKNYKVSTHGGHWWWRRMGCRVSCIFGKCDEGTVCGQYDDLKELFSKVDIDKGFYIKDKKLYLREDYKKYFVSEEKNTTRLIADKNDRLLVSIIERSQFPCNTTYNISVGSNTQAGLEISLKPVTLAQLSAKGDLLVDKLPKGFSEDFEIGLKVVKYCDEKVQCDVWTFYDKLNRLKTHFHPAEYTNMPFVLDTQTAKVPEPFVEVKALSFIIPFEKNKFDYKQSDIDPFIDSLNEPKFVIQEIRITAYSSIEGDSVKNFELQQKRAASIVKVLEQQQAGAKIKYVVKNGDTWNLFRKQILLTNYYYLADSGLTAVNARLNKDTALLRKLEHILKEERFASIEMRVSFDLKKLKEDDYWMYRMQKALDKKDLKRALSNQTALIKLYQENKISYEKLMSQNLPNEVKYISLLNNKYLYTKDPEEQIKRFEELLKTDPNNPIVKYNYLAMKMNALNALNEDQRREELHILASLFSSLNATAIPGRLYNTLRARFHIVSNENSNRKSKKPETYNNVKDLSKNSPVIEALALADYYADMKRFDIAAQILFDHYNEVSPEEDAKICQEYSLRILYYGKASGNAAFDKQYHNVFKKLQKCEPALFCEIFSKNQVSFKFFENLHVKKMFCDQCQK